jgi:hypothetical protein
MMRSRQRCAAILLLWTGYFAAVHTAGPIISIFSTGEEQRRALWGYMEGYRYRLGLLFYWGFGVVTILVSYWRSRRKAGQRDVGAQGRGEDDNNARKS